MIIEIDPESLAITATFFIFFILLGAAVERTAHFFWPRDFFSILIYITGIAVILILLMFKNTIPVELMFISLIAYLVGYVASSRRKHVNLFKVNVATREIDVPYVIPYKKGEKWFLQRQSAKEHAKRVLFGITTELSTNWDLRDQWTIGFQDPIFPTIKIKAVITEIYNPDKFEYVRKGPFKMKKYTPEIYVSPKGMATCLELITISDAHQKDIRTNLDLTAELFKEKHTSETRNNRDTASLLMRIFKSSPMSQLNEVIIEKKAEEEKKNQEVKKQIPEHMKRGWFRRGGDAGQ